MKVPIMPMSSVPLRKKRCAEKTTGLQLMYLSLNAFSTHGLGVLGYDDTFPSKGLCNGIYTTGVEKGWSKHIGQFHIRGISLELNIF